MNRRTKVFVAAALVLGIIIGWPTVAHYRIKSKLAAYQRQLRAQGEKLTITEVAPVTVPEGTWCAHELMAAHSQLCRMVLVPNLTNQPPAMHMVVPGHALVGWQQDPLPTSDMTNVWPSLRLVLARGETGLEQAHAALQSPRLTVPLDYSQGPNLLLPHLMQFKVLAQWFSAETVLALHERHPEEAREGLQALTALTQRFEEEPIMISLLVRIAISAIAVNTTWEALQGPDLQEPQLRELQQAWSAMDVLTQAEGTLAMERASHAELFARGRESYANIANLLSLTGSGSSAMASLAQLGQDVLDNPKEGLNSLARRYPGYWKWKVWQSYDDELANSETLQAGIEALRTARKQGAFGPALQTFEQATNAILQAHPNTGSWFPISVAQDGSIRRFLSRVTTFEVQRSLVVAALALKRYQLAHGAYPAQLGALAPEFLAQVPRDPMDGKPLRYRLNADGSFLLYSIGSDGVDNGGDPRPAPSTPERMQWLQVRDVVWPAVASPQETAAYFQELARKRKDPDTLAYYARRYGLRPDQIPPTATPPAPAPPASATNTTPAQAEFYRRYGLRPPSPPPVPVTNAPGRQ